MKGFTDIGISKSTFETDSVAWKAEIDKLDIKKLVNVPTVLSKVKTNVQDLDTLKFKTVQVDLERLCCRE